jgi:hypothetical protein
MKRDKVWLRQQLNKNSIGFEPGQKIVLFRKKQNGYPKFLNFGTIYRVLRIESDNLYICEDGRETEWDNDAFAVRYNRGEYKIDKSYMIPIGFNRINLIDDILSSEEEEK